MILPSAGGQMEAAALVQTADHQPLTADLWGRQSISSGLAGAYWGVCNNGISITLRCELEEPFLPKRQTRCPCEQQSTAPDIQKCVLFCCSG